MIETEILEMELDGRNYRLEFDREAIKTVDGSGVLREGAGTLELTASVLYAGLCKHHGEVTRKKAKDMIDRALDEGYVLDDFSDLLDEFTRCYKALFSQSGGKKMKKALFTRPAEKQ